jgi:hypothetical protein
MPKFSTEIRTTFDKPYIKVFLANNSDLATVKERLDLLQSVRRVNISNDNRDLTVYVKQPFSANEAETYVKQTIEAFYSESGNDTETIMCVRQIRNALHTNSKVRKCYDDALNKIITAKYDRNSLDDIRLALELYLKEVLGNDKPLEKQNNALKEYLEDKKVSSELVNVHTQSLYNLCKFFNNHAKHDYNVKREEVDSVIGYANQIMKSILNIN